MDAEEIKEEVDDSDDEHSTDSQMEAEEMKEEVKEEVEHNDDPQSAGGEALEYDESAYVMYHRAQTGALDIELLALKVNVIVFAMTPSPSRDVPQVLSSATVSRNTSPGPNTGLSSVKKDRIRIVVLR